MKKMVLLCCIALSISRSGAFAQRMISVVDNKAYHEVNSFNITCCYNKTTHILFPQAIKYVDLGSTGIIADKADAIDNVLRIKASKEDFKETSMSVITADGSYYSFIVNFSSNPQTLNYSFSSKNNVVSVVPEHVNLGNVDSISFSNSDMSQAEMSQYSDWMIDHKRTIKHIGAISYEFNFSLRGIYIKGNTMFIDVMLKNMSNIDYDIDFIKFYVKDKEVSKRTPMQNIEINPLFNYPVASNKITGNTDIQKVFIFEKFTIPDDKIMIAEVYEKNGGRHLEFIIENSDIIRARLPKKLLSDN